MHDAMHKLEWLAYTHTEQVEDMCAKCLECTAVALVQCKRPVLTAQPMCEMYVTHIASVLYSLRSEAPGDTRS